MNGLDEKESAFLAAAVARLKHPFRANPDSGELSRDRDDYEARSATVRALLALLDAGALLDDALHHVTLRSSGGELDVGPQLIRLWLSVRELFPGLVPPC